MIIGMIIIVLVLCGIVGLAHYLAITNISTLQDHIVRLQRVGQVRKFLNFLNYFAYRTIQDSTDNQARTLLNR